VACPLNRCTRPPAKTSPKPARTRPGRPVQALEHGIGRLSQPADQNRPALPFASEPASYKEALEGLDERWGDPAYWQAIRRNTSSITPFYLLAAVDHRIDDLGELAPATPDQAIYLDIFARTFWMGLVITVICLVLAYPLAYLLANLPSRKATC
jgi:hypothetical protein